MTLMRDTRSTLSVYPTGLRTVERHIQCCTSLVVVAKHLEYYEMNVYSPSLGNSKTQKSSPKNMLCFSAVLEHAYIYYVKDISSLSQVNKMERRRSINRWQQGSDHSTKGYIG